MLKLFRILALALIFTTLFATASLAQESEATAEATAEIVAEEGAIESAGEIAETVTRAPNLSPAILFLGAGAIVFVGLLMIARDNFRGETE